MSIHIDRPGPSGATDGLSSLRDLARPVRGSAAATDPARQRSTRPARVAKASVADAMHTVDYSTAMPGRAVRVMHEQLMRPDILISPATGGRMVPNIILPNVAAANAASVSRHSFDPLRPRNFIAKASALDMTLTPDNARLNHLITVMLASGALTDPDDRFGLKDTAIISSRFRCVIDPSLDPGHVERRQYSRNLYIRAFGVTRTFGAHAYEDIGVRRSPLLEHEGQSPLTFENGWTGVARSQTEDGQQTGRNGRIPMLGAWTRVLTEQTRPVIFDLNFLIKADITYVPSMNEDGEVVAATQNYNPNLGRYAWGPNNAKVYPQQDAESGIGQVPRFSVVYSAEVYVTSDRYVVEGYQGPGGY